MKARTLSKLLQNQPAPLTWALLNLPTRLPKNWKRIEHTFDGALYERQDGLCARASGLEDVMERRWWHLIVGFRDGRHTSPKDMLQVQRIFYPEHAMVLVALLPHGERADVASEDAGVLHMWWNLDGVWELPDPSTWLDEPWVENDLPPVDRC